MRIRWTDEMIAEEFSKYSRISDLIEASHGAYSAAVRRGLVEKLSTHMTHNVMPNRVWTDEKLAEEARKHNTRAEFSKQNNGAYLAASRRGILDDICSHMTKLRIRWDNDTLKEEAAKYPTRKQFKIGSPKAFTVTEQRGLMSEMCSHMSREPLISKWTFDALKIEAKKYATRGEFQIGNNGAYLAAHRQGVFEDICSHMPKFDARKSNWSADDVAKEALKYETRNDFRTKSAAYVVAKKLGILDDVCQHMLVLQKNWTNDDLIKEALNYKCRADLRRENPSVYFVSHTRGIIDDVCSHMVDGSPTDNDVIYIWRLLNEQYNGNPIYKIGVTSKRLGDKRIEQVSKRLGVDFEIVIKEAVECRATQVEKKLLRVGKDPKFLRTDGYTELRAMSDDELLEALTIVAMHAEGAAL